MFKLYFILTFSLLYQNYSLAQFKINLVCNKIVENDSSKETIYVNPFLRISGLKNKVIEKKLNFKLEPLFITKERFRSQYAINDSSYSLVEIPPTQSRYNEFCASLLDTSNKIKNFSINYQVVDDKFLLLNVGNCYLVEDESIDRCKLDSIFVLWYEDVYYNVESYIFDLETGDLLNFWDLFNSEEKKYEFIRLIDFHNKEYESGYDNTSMNGPYGLEPWRDSFIERATDFYDAVVITLEPTKSLKEFIEECRQPFYLGKFYDRVGANPEFLIFLDTTYCNHFLIIKANVEERGFNITQSNKDGESDLVSFNFISKGLLMSYLKPKYYNLIFKNE